MPEIHHMSPVQVCAVGCSQYLLTHISFGFSQATWLIAGVVVPRCTQILSHRPNMRGWHCTLYYFVPWRAELPDLTTLVQKVRKIIPGHSPVVFAAMISLCVKPERSDSENQKHQLDLWPVYWLCYRCKKHIVWSALNYTWQSGLRFDHSVSQTTSGCLAGWITFWSLWGFRFKKQLRTRC